MPNQTKTGSRARRASGRRHPLIAGAGRIVHALTTPLVPGDFIDQISPLHNPTALRGRIAAVIPEAAGAVTLVIRPSRSWPGHVPGQYARIGVDVEGVRLWRSYSITSAPDTTDGRFTLTVKAVPGGLVSNYLVTAKVGTIVELEPAAGEFRLPEQLPQRVLFITAGSGITPVMAMLRSHALADAVVVHSAPTAKDVIFGPELREMASAGVIRLVERHTRESGRLGADDLLELVPDLADREAWACGPAAMLDELEAMYANRGMAEKLRTERFSAVFAATGDGGPVTFAGSAVTVDGDGSTPLLEVGEAAGVLLPSGCRMGICYGCVLPLESGSVRDLRNGNVTTASPGDGVKVQTCISAAAGPCQLQA